VEQEQVIEMTDLELIPVKDIKVTKNMSADQLLKAMGEAGGFTAQKLADATNIVEAMVKDKDCLKILSFPACIMATGTRGVIVDMVKNGLVDLIITTCGTLDHDLSRSYAEYYKGDFMMDDEMLREKYEISRDRKSVV
jgi:deoxyhypusine synthase